MVYEKNLYFLIVICWILYILRLVYASICLFRPWTDRSLLLLQAQKYKIIAFDAIIIAPKVWKIMRFGVIISYFNAESIYYLQIRRSSGELFMSKVKPISGKVKQQVDARDSIGRCVRLDQEILHGCEGAAKSLLCQGFIPIMMIHHGLNDSASSRQGWSPHITGNFGQCVNMCFIVQAVFALFQLFFCENPHPSCTILRKRQ